MTIGDNIKRIRKERNMTQRELGEKLGGISQQQIAQWESGRKKPKLETLRKIASALQISINDLFVDEWKDSPIYRAYEKSGGLESDLFLDYKNASLTKGINWEPIDIELINKFKALNEAGQVKAIEQVDLLTKIPEFTKDEEQALRNYLDFIKDKDSNYWDEFRKTLLKIEAQKAKEDSGESAQ